MKEDILEQLVDDYLQSEGYFTRHNLKFRPRDNHPSRESKKDSNHSDIDVVGFHPTKTAIDRVVIVSCKSWQAGFKVDTWLDALAHDKVLHGRKAWQAFRELTVPKWSEALLDEVQSKTGTKKFEYILAVTAVIGDRKRWETHQAFRSALNGNPIRILTLAEMLSHIDKLSTTTVAASQIGRVLQLMKAAKKGEKALIETIKAQGEVTDEPA